MNPRPHVCFDRILPRELFLPAGTMQVAGRTRAISPIGKTWMNGSTLHVRFIGGTAAERANAQVQAGWWQAACNLGFVFDDAPQAEIRIAFNPDDGAWSYIGTDARSIPYDQPTMNLGFEDGGTAAHEFGHAIGLAHEHQNPAGGIQWNEVVVIRELGGPPNNWSEAMTRHNVLARYATDQINGTQFDPDSVMLYFFPASWTTNGIATHANHVLSALDREFVAGARMYPKAQGPTVGSAVTLAVNARERTPATIGQFGEEDLYTFTVAQRGLHIVDTQGPSDVVMKLFGPDSPTALIAEDDDSGIGRNARIARALMPGRHWVQVRHYNRRSGVGDYSVRVRRSA
ncbi:M12 family metallopeptidase [Leptothrix discophora]|uniref:M12 family metallopeptidase n=1 Tax=Leptothrix discophora TaxID=89 RepID=A0ABT9FYP5_LEPDI|nr:M12 family metallopeptidase [Leptothrix discophora]MDP4299350.1 M12 family metallopeptidase [Leptothrix discophora]